MRCKDLLCKVWMYVCMYKSDRPLEAARHGHGAATLVWGKRRWGKEGERRGSVPVSYGNIQVQCIIEIKSRNIQLSK